jgi:hypothetical protein
MVVHDTPTSTVDVAYEQQPSVPDDESTASPQVAIAQVVAPVTPGPCEEEKATNEVHLYASKSAPVVCVSQFHHIALITLAQPNWVPS